MVSVDMFCCDIFVGIVFSNRWCMIWLARLMSIKVTRPVTSKKTILFSLLILVCFMLWRNCSGNFIQWVESLIRCLSFLCRIFASLYVSVLGRYTIGSKRIPFLCILNKKVSRCRKDAKMSAHLGKSDSNHNLMNLFYFILKLC